MKIAGKHIGEVAELSIRRRRRLVRRAAGSAHDKQNEIAARILKEIRERLRFLVDVGLDYLTLSRDSGTLSGGESQRIRLATQIGSGLTGVLYVLDEPSIGLHQRDNARLLDTLKHLRDIGNTVIVVEHDEEAILHRRLRHRHRPGRRHPRRPRHRRRARRDDIMAKPDTHHRPVPVRRASRSRCRRRGASRRRARRSRWSARAATT